MQNAPFHIFTHNTHFGHHPRPLCLCLRRLFFSEIIQCLRLGLSLGRTVCFSHDAIWALCLGADSPTDEMKQEGRLRSLPLIWEVSCLMLQVHFLGYSEVGVVPAPVRYGCETHTEGKYFTNKLAHLFYNACSQDFRWLHHTAQPTHHTRLQHIWLLRCSQTDLKYELTVITL